MKRSTLVLAGLLVPALASAQLPNLSTRSLGMGGAYTSLAQGYEAVVWNPAMLATWNRPGFTLGLPQGAVELGSNTYGFSDFRKYAHSFLTDSVKQVLFNKIAPTDSTLTVRTLASGLVGLSIGPVGLAVAGAGEMNMALGRDLVDLALFGNARRTAAGQSYLDRASNGSGWLATTIAASLAVPFSLPVGRLSVGVTGKYVLGNFLLSGRDVNTQIANSPTFNFTSTTEAIYSDTASACALLEVRLPSGLSQDGFKECRKYQQVGNGFGADVGATLQLLRGGVTLSAVLVNAVGKMTWNEGMFAYERTTRTISQNAAQLVTDTVTNHVLLKGSNAIGGDATARALRDSVLAHADFAKLARLGVALHSGHLSLAANVQVRLKEGLDQQPAQLVAGGAEYVLLGFLPLRAGASWDFNGATTLAAGAGLQFFGVHLDFSAANTSGTVRPGLRLGAGLGLIF
jgi:hypothetical protein